MSVFAPAACPCCASPNPCACPPDSPWISAVDGDLYTARISIEGISPGLGDPPPLSWGMFNLNPDTVGEGGWLWYNGDEDPADKFRDEFYAGNPQATPEAYAAAWCAEIKPQYLDQGGRQWSGVGGPDLDGIELRMTDLITKEIVCLPKDKARCDGLGWHFSSGWRPGIDNGPNAIPNTPGDIDESKSKVTYSFDLNFIPNAYSDTIDYIAIGMTSTVLTFRIPSRPWTDYFYKRYGHKYDFVDDQGFHGYPTPYDPNRNYGPATYTASYSVGWFFSTGTIKHADLCNQSSITIVNKAREGKHYNDSALYRLCQHSALPDPDQSSGSSASYFPPDSSSSESEGIGQQDGDWAYGPLFQINGAGSVTVTLETCPTDRDLSSASSASSATSDSSSSSSSVYKNRSSSSHTSQSDSSSVSSDTDGFGHERSSGSSQSRSSVSINDSHSSQTLFNDQSSASSNPFEGDSFSVSFDPGFSSASSPSSPSSVSSVVDISSPSSVSSHSSQSSSSSSSSVSGGACSALTVQPCVFLDAIIMTQATPGPYANWTGTSASGSYGATLHYEIGPSHWTLTYQSIVADDILIIAYSEGDDFIGVYQVDSADGNCQPTTIVVACVGPPDDHSSSSSHSSVSSQSSQSEADNSSSSSSSSGVCRMSGTCAHGPIQESTGATLDSNQSTLSTRCRIYQQTCIDIGTGDHGHFLSSGIDYLWHTTTGTPSTSLAPESCNCPDAPNQYVIVTRVDAYIDD